MISLVLAMTNKKIIGKNNKLPWYYPEELKNFKNITMGKKILMGRKTFESIGKSLPGREMIVISRNKKMKSDYATFITDIDSYINKYKNCNEELQIIGGLEVFNISLKHADKIYLSIIKKDFDGDICFKNLDLSLFNKISQKDYKNFIAFEYERK